MNTDLNRICQHFAFEGKFLEAKPHGCGHINDTYAVYFQKADGAVHRFILQRINRNVFKEPEKLMENIAGITAHVRQKVVAAGGDPNRETLNLVSAIDGDSFYKTPEGDYWRVYLFIENAQTYQIVANANHFYNAGKAFGKFQKLVSDFPAERLHETIPNFHHTRKRYEAFLEAVKKDTAGRAGSVRREIEFVEKRADETSILVDLLLQGKMPARVTHNDTKFNNVMIDDRTGAGICVIDLDTVMPGSSLYDYGDSIRFGANPAAEDEKDLAKVWMELTLFEQFTKGFLEAAGPFMTPVEIEYLPFAAKLMTLECGIRFLADYLNGDIYFKIHHGQHNLDRARTQFKLVADMETKMNQMKEIVERHMEDWRR